MRPTANGFPNHPPRAIVDWGKVWEFFHQFKANRAWALVLMVPNLLGIVGGYYYYYDVGQFNPASAYFRSYAWWPFIADSPTAVLLMSVSLVAYAFWGKRSKVFDAIAFTAMLYVGLWTTTLFLTYPDIMGTFRIGSTNNMLFVSHMGMPLEALLLVRDMRMDRWKWLGVGGVLAWNGLNLYLDYWGPHLHPAPFVHMGLGLYDPNLLPPNNSPNDAVLHLFSPLLMGFTLAMWLLVVWKGTRTVRQ